MEPTEIKYNPNLIKPETVEFFKVVTNKLDNGKVESICFSDVLFCEIRKDFSNWYEGFYVINHRGILKTGIIKSIDKKGNFLLESQTEDKKLFPDYFLNVSDCRQFFRVLYSNRKRGIKSYPKTENWDDFDEVKYWEPSEYEDKLTYCSILKKYFRETT